MHSSLGHNLQLGNPQGRAANSLYAYVRQRGQRSQLWASLTRQSRGLLALGEVGEACSIEADSDSDLHAVVISQIQGSESRCADFDRDFNPLQDHTRERWLSIAQARERGKSLPPVALIQVGDLYFVRDGHHRISVARALGQTVIEATVEVWQVDGPVPWGEKNQPASGQHAHRNGDAHTLTNGWRAAPILGWLSGLLQALEGAAASQSAG